MSKSDTYDRAGLAIAVLVVLAILGAAIWRFQNNASFRPIEPVAAATQEATPATDNFESTALSAGIDDPSAYASAARNAGLEPASALAADLIICAETNQCPNGMTRDGARITICYRTGKMC